MMPSTYIPSYLTPHAIDTGFTMTGQRLRAAGLVADGNMPYDEIARSVGVQRTALTVWLRHPIFRSEVDRIRAEILSEVIQQGVALRSNRLRIYNDIARRILHIIHASEEDARVNPRTPGDESGLIGEHVIPTRGGGVVYEYQFNDSIVKTLQGLLKQAAQEVGEWDERQSVDVRVLVSRLAAMEGLSDDEVAEVDAKAKRYIAELATGV